MTEQELQFHYFKMHDADNNNKLDGCELIKSLIHWHGKFIELSICCGLHLLVLSVSYFFILLCTINVSRFSICFLLSLSGAWCLNVFKRLHVPLLCMIRKIVKFLHSRSAIITNDDLYFIDVM